MYIWNIIFSNSYYEFFLPNINNRAIVEKIPSSVSGLSLDIALSAEVWNNEWRLIENQEIAFVETHPVVPLEDNMIVKCAVRASGERFTVLISEVTDTYSSFVKYVLPGRTLKIGRDPDNDICADYQNLVSGHHAVIESIGSEPALTDLSSNGTFVNGLRIKPKSKHLLAFGDVINIFGLKIVFLGNIISINNPVGKVQINRLARPGGAVAANAPATPPDEYFQRSPRAILQLDSETVSIDSPPSPQLARRQPLLFTIGPAFTMAVPLVIGLLFMMQASQATGGAPSPFLFMGIITSAAAALLGAFWGVASFRHARRTEAAAEEKRKAAYCEYLGRMSKLLDDKHEFNRNALMETYPPAEACFAYADEGVLRLWDRNVNHSDFLAVRLGMGDVRSPNSIDVGKETFTLVDDDMADKPRDIKQKYRILRNVPVCLDLQDHRLVGVIAPSGRACAEIAHVLVTQLASCNSYSDIRMVFLYGPGQAHEYGFAKWLPHVWNEQGSLRMVACDPLAKDEILYDLSNTLRKRAESSTQKSKPLPHYIVFVSEPSFLENEPLTKILYDPPEGMGLSVVLLYGKIGQLPNSCTTIIRHDSEYSGYYSMDSAEAGLDKVSFDSVNAARLDRFSRVLSGVRLREARLEGAVPDKLTFMDMHKITGRLIEVDIYRKWLENRTYESMGAAIGYRNADTPLMLDIHEKAHGPHGLVAGTTGSGKSEALQTYILSLAMNYHPHEISFILIDYKGGGMAQSFMGLPHVTGVITNLGGNRTNRALAAIRSEIKRRQKVFSEYGLKHIDEYIELFREKGADGPMPHLLIIVDEFAELKKEQGNFVHELISVARVGRSLGVHLILATQKPSACVDDEIQSNSRFRLCLRVQDKQDSIDMIRCPDAALITIPGRGYFQVGNNELFESFQSGWSGAPYDPGSSAGVNDDVARIINLQGKRLSGKYRKSAPATANAKTQLQAIVDHIKALATRKRITPVSPIWLPPLPDRVCLQPDTGAGDKGAQTSISAKIGIVDDPRGQRQYQLFLDIVSSGHMLVAAASGGGKTTFLQTLLYSLTTTYCPEQVIAYIIDLGSRNLGVFSALPHIGGVAYDSDSDKIDKLIAMLTREVVERKLRFAEKGVGTYKEYRQEYDDLPAIMLVIDNFEAFAENFVKHEETMISFSREAASFGVYMAITCMCAKDIRGRLRQNFNFGIGIQLSDRFEYEDAVGSRVEFIPDASIPGRGLIRDGSSILEFQTALCVDAPNAARINSAIRAQVNSIKGGWRGMSASPIPQVPEDVSVGAIWSLPAVQSRVSNGRYLPIGFDLSEAEPLYIDLGTTFCYSISGAERTGKTTLLKALMLLSKMQGASCCIFDGQDQELKQYALAHEVRYLTTSDELFAYMSDTIVPEFTRRNKGKEVFQQNDRQDLDKYIKSEQKICVFINSMEAFCESVYGSEKSMSGFVEQMLTKGDDHMIYFFACVANSDLTGPWNARPLMRKFTGRKAGVHLGGAVDNQRIFDFEIPALERAKKMPPGKGYAIENGVTKRVITIH